MVTRINFLNTFINIMNKKDYLKIISSSLHNNDKTVFFYLNTHSFYLLNTNEEFNKCFNDADFITPDGYSIKWAIKFLYKKHIEKVSFNHIFFESLSKLFSKEHFRIFLLGGREHLLKLAVDKLTKRPLNLNVVGFHDGYSDQSIDSDKIISKINSSNPDILLVGIGMPESVIWIMKNKTRIKSKLIFTVGNLFDIIAGEKSIAPSSLYNTPFEWLYKLFQEPLKLIPRYIIVHPYFIYSMIKEKIFSSQTSAL
jgi:N-acetylglucosaminyldiphosphoundecaprenol N-acetyl-beta-D-mannosaminyltransferase